MDNKVTKLGVDELMRGKYQPRTQFSEKELEELSASIKLHGIIQPIVARRAGQRYEIIAGERRWRAAQLAGLMEVSCLVIELSDEKAAQISLIENIQRQDLNVIEEARAYQRLIDDFTVEHQTIAAMVGKSREKISNVLRLLKLDTRIQAMLLNRELTEGHGKSLCSADLRHQFWLAKQAVEYAWSVRRLESEIKKLGSTAAKGFVSSNKDVEFVERHLSDYLSNPVKIHTHSEQGGKIEISFSSLEIFDGILEKIGFKLEAME